MDDFDIGETPNGWDAGDAVCWLELLETCPEVLRAIAQELELVDDSEIGVGD